MTIEEAIEHFKIIEQDSRQEAINIESNLYLPKSIDRDRLVTDCNRVADTNKQIADWLEELKDLRKWKEQEEKACDKWYNKAIEDFISRAEEERNNLWRWDEDEYENGVKAGYQYSIEIAEELKEGAEDDD